MRKYNISFSEKTLEWLKRYAERLDIPMSEAHRRLLDDVLGLDDSVQADVNLELIADEDSRYKKVLMDLNRERLARAKGEQQALKSLIAVHQELVELSEAMTGSIRQATDDRGVLTEVISKGHVLAANQEQLITNQQGHSEILQTLVSQIGKLSNALAMLSDGLVAMANNHQLRLAHIESEDEGAPAVIQEARENGRRALDHGQDAWLQNAAVDLLKDRTP